VRVLLESGVADRTILLVGAEAQILQLLRSGRHPNHVADIGRYRRSWTADDVQRVIRQHADPPAGQTGTATEDEPVVVPVVERVDTCNLTAWRPPYCADDPAVVIITAAQARVLTALCRGMSNLAIAAEVGISVDTVKSHVKDLMGCTRRRDRLQLALAAVTGQLDVFVRRSGRAVQISAGGRRG
jgi:DNA-binding CsgD family transcriptional regulator